MGSSKGKRSESGASWREKLRARRRRLVIDSLEDRCLLTTSPVVSPWLPTDPTNLYDPINGPIANAGTDLVDIYHQFAVSGSVSPGQYSPAGQSRMVFQGNDVGVEITGKGSQSTETAALTALGMQVQNVAPQPNVFIVSGLLPASQIANAAELPGTVGMAAIRKNTYYAATGGTGSTSVNTYTGQAHNEAVVAENIGAARSQFGVTGAGVTVGVISDSVNQYPKTGTAANGDGIYQSVATGDIPSASRVNVLADGPSGSTDEGRAMIENIFDAAPGVNTAFNTAGTGGSASMATAVTALANQAHAQVIVDDVGLSDEPFFQNGILAQAIQKVVGQGVSYFTAAGNAGNDGYLSPWRGTSANVTGVGQGTYFNFNPNGGTATSLTFTVPAGQGVSANNPAEFQLQWDNPWYTSGSVTTNIDPIVLNSSGTVVWSAANDTNAIATQTPQQFVDLTSAGTYTLVLQLAAGPAPNYVEFLQDSDTVVQFTQPFGSAGGVSYPTAWGHSDMIGSNGAIGALSVGAVPFWDTPAYNSVLTTPGVFANESYSSTGPGLHVFNSAGQRLSSPIGITEPLVSGVDGTNTSFFIPGQIIDTTQATPSTTVNVAQTNFPTFTGTSAAAENVAAIAALMKQYAPSATPAEIYSAIQASAVSTPLNGATAGTWNAQGGYGLVDAVTALSDVTLHVVSVVPGGGQTTAQAPGYIQVTFSQPVNFATVSAANLAVIGPAGTSVYIGAPVPIGSTTAPTVVDFPIAIVHNPGTIANGVYHVGVGNGVYGETGQLLKPFADTFTLADTTPPAITGVKLLGRTIAISFSKAIDPSTVNKADFILVRANSPTGRLGTPSQVIVSNDSRVLLTYDPTNFTVTMDLSALPQSLLPGDVYGIVVVSPAYNTAGGLIHGGVADVVGVGLSGTYNGYSFPTGNGLPGGNFGEVLGDIGAAPPVFNSVQLATQSDSGIQGDQNTNVQRPTFVGQIGANFPGTAAGVMVLAEFNGIAHTNLATGQAEPAGTIDLTTGLNGRGYSGNYDAVAFTNAAGQFAITAPANLPNGLNIVKFVAIAQPDAPPLPGLASSTSLTVRIDTTLPTINTAGSHPDGSSIAQASNLASLTNLSIYVTDPVQPSTLGSPFAVPTLLTVPALDPTTATNLGNYVLDLQGPNGTLINESAFIASATYVSTTDRVYTTDPYTGQINLTFSTGLPNGTYFLTAKDTITDAAGNPLAGNPATPGVASNYVLTFNLQPQPVYITSLLAVSPNGVLSNPRAYFEVPAVAGQANADGTPTPPSQFIIDVSNPLQAGVNYTPDVQLIASANTAGGTPDGNFGTLGTSDSGSGYSLVPGTTVALTSIPLADGQMPTPGQPGYDERLVLSLASGTTLAPDYYRLYIPNNINPTTGANTQIFDQYGNQLDGEFLGDQTTTGAFETLLPNGQYRAGLSGNGIAGGSFMTGYVVVPNGNVIFANPSYQYDPYNQAQYPDGSPSRPYPVLAPEAVPTAINGGNLNSPINFGPNFNPVYDRSGRGFFEPSALFAAQVASALGPVVVVAEPGTVITDPSTGQTTQASFVLQAPASGNSGVNDGSVSIPTMTTLVFQPGATLKLQNASLFVQNQGSALEVLGTANNQVTFTSYADNTVGGNSNPSGSNLAPQAGDWGGIVFRNFDQQNRSNTFAGQIPVTGNPSVDNRLKGPGGADAISGADEIMSMINFAVIKYGGGAVPQGVGTRYSSITLINARPAVTNTVVSNSGGAGGADAGISVNFDSLRQDNVAAGPLFRRLTFANNSLNGIYIQGQPNGVAEPTNAMSYPVNPTNMGGSANYVINSPYPYLLTTPIVIGSVYQENTGGQQTYSPVRLYVDPGMMMKFETGTGIEVKSAALGSRQASLNVGDRTYMNEFDANPNISPVLADGSPNPNFVPNSTNNATVLFTSLYDNTASTSYTDPTTGITTQIVAPLAATNNSAAFQPTPTSVLPQARWGGIQIDSPAVAVINNATLRYGGGFVNTPTGTATRHALELAGAGGFGANGTGTHVSITNDNFYYNADVPMNITANGMFAGNPDQPLLSGAPFFHGNVMVGNTINGLGVSGSNGIPGNASDTVDAVWPGTDLTYIVRDTIAMGPFSGYLPPPPSTTAPADIPTPTVTLTVQSTLPGTILADGTVVPKPGIPAIIKLDGSAPAASSGNTTQPLIGSGTNEGAGFVSGMDNGVDPTSNPLIDLGVNSEMRFLGIGGNQATGQARVPVVITSIHDSTYGTTVRGVTMNVAITGDTQAPAAGDGGNIIFGSHTMTSYNLNDPRQGNLIDNVDLKYLSRVEQIGGGIINLYDVTGKGSYSTTSEPNYTEKIGQPVGVAAAAGGATTNYGTQYNAPNAMTISNSNFFDFRDFGFWAHPGFQSIGVPQNYTGTIGRGPLGQQATQTFLVNDTFSGMTAATAAVEIDGNNVDNSAFPSPSQAVLLNDTFYNNAIGININNPLIPGSTSVIPGASAGVAYNGINDLSSVNFLSMNNLFSNQTTAAIDLNKQVWGSQTQYDLYYNNKANVLNNGTTGWQGDNQAVIGNPDFVDAAAGNFNLGPNSAAINAGRSELGPSVFGDMLYPAANQVLNATGGVLNFIGRSNPFGGVGNAPSPLDYVFLPGSPLPNYVTSWVPVLPDSPYAIPGPSSNNGTWDYASLTAIAAGSNGQVVVPPGGGERDQNGVERVDDPKVGTVGAGSQPYFDIGAFQYIQYFPPEVTAVTATYADPTTGALTTKNIYAVGGVAGTNIAPQSIQVQFNHQLDPTTINGQTVQLEASSDGLFNLNNGNTYFINLAGKLSFDSATSTLTIGLGSSGLVLGNDEYRLILVGTGSQELRDLQGNALDGSNIGTTGQQSALPSGTGIPGSNFQVTFTVDTHKPAIIPGSFSLAATSYSNPDYAGSGITNQTRPTFQGSITDIFPPTNPVAGDTVYIDISTLGNGVFNDLNAGVGTTDTNGNFSITLTTPLPNSNYTVGSSGLLSPATAGGDFLARVRVVNTAGNASNTVTGTIQSFQAQSALYAFLVDARNPVVTSVTPAPGSLANVTNGVIPVTIDFNKNIDPKTITAGSIQVVRTGGSGTFGAGNLAEAIDPASVKVTPLHTPGGAEQLTFNIIGTAAAPLANDQYMITLKGTGSTPILDVAGNALAGNTTSASDLAWTFLVDTPSLAHDIFVGASSYVTAATQAAGTRANPYPTIAAGLAAAKVGDVVAVLPGVYTEAITLKSLVTLESASAASVDGLVLPGDPLQTIIRAPFGTGGATVTGSGLVSADGGLVRAILSGFTVASPLSGDPASGTITPYSTGIALTNSSIVVANSYFIDSAAGAMVVASGTGAPMPTFANDVFAGDTTGLGVIATASTTTGLGLIANSDFVYNTFGLAIDASASTPSLYTVANNIFWQNHSQDGTSAGNAIGSSEPNRLLLYSNMFSQNGPGLNNPALFTFNVATGGFDPAALQANVPDVWGNFIGTPAFVAPRNPAPPVAGGDGPAIFFLDGNFDLTQSSGAIDRANPAYAPATDLMFRGRVTVGGGFAYVPAIGGPTGPADVGAFEFNGTGGVVTATAALQATSSTLASGATFLAEPMSASSFATSAVPVGTSPTALIVKFSAPVNQATLRATDLVVGGSGDSPSSPIRATSLTWIDSQTVEFNLTGGYNQSGGTVQLGLPDALVLSQSGLPLAGFTDVVTLDGSGSSSVPPVVYNPPTSGTGSPVLPPTQTTSYQPTSPPTYSLRIKSKG